MRFGHGSYMSYRSYGTYGTYGAKALLSLQTFYFSSKRMPPVPSGTGTGGSGAW